MNMFDETYRDHRIAFRRGGRVAYIVPVGELLALNVFPSATMAEGLLVLRARAHAAIDAEIAKKER